jgi:hypothetical protein
MENFCKEHNYTFLEEAVECTASLLVLYKLQVQEYRDMTEEAIQERQSVWQCDTSRLAARRMRDFDRSGLEFRMYNIVKWGKKVTATEQDLRAIVAALGSMPKD